MSHTVSNRAKLRVAVIGAGIGGAAAAVAVGSMERSQYSTSIYERIVKSIGTTEKELNAVVGAGYRSYSTNEEEMSKALVGDGLDGDGALRVEGASVNIFYGSKVVDVDPERARLFLTDGNTVTADPIIGAGRIHPKVRAAVVPMDHPARVLCGLSVYRFVLPMEVVKEAINAGDLMPTTLRTEEGGFVASHQGQFDVILNTSTGHSSGRLYRTLACFGHFVFLGPAESHAHSMSAELLKKNAHLSFIDAFNFLDPELGLGSYLLTQVDQYLRQGVLSAIQPVVSTEVSQSTKFSPDLIEGNLVGKLVATFEYPESSVRALRPVPRAALDPEASYVITGGLRGLSCSIVQWMADRGARHIALLSRRKVESVAEAETLISSLAAKGVHVAAIVYDVTNQRQLNSTLQNLSGMRPIKGVIHAAVSYEDVSFDKLDAATWQKGPAAKVVGTKNLHHATLSQSLDFFVMTTTHLSVLALTTPLSPGPRHSQRGLPASMAFFSLNNDITNVGSDEGTIKTFERNEALTLSEHQFLDLFEAAFLPPSTQQGSADPKRWFGASQDPLSAANFIICLDPAAMLAKKKDEDRAPSTKPRWHADARVSLIMRAFADAQAHADSAPDDGADENASKTAPARVKREFEAALAKGVEGKAETAVFVEKSIAAMVAEMLFMDEEGVDAGKSIADHGVDSLIAAELRNWFVNALGANISMLHLLDPSKSIRAVADGLVKERLEGKE